MLRFWYKYIPKARSVIELGHGDIYYDKIVKPELHSFMGSVFEDMCRHYTLEKGIQGAFGSLITQVGNWWGMETIINENGAKISQPADIDVVAISDADKTSVIGECKFHNEKIDKGVYEALRHRAHLLTPKIRIVKLLMFSLSGYTDWFQSLEDADLLLLTLPDLYC